MASILVGGNSRSLPLDEIGRTSEKVKTSIIWIKHSLVAELEKEVMP